MRKAKGFVNVEFLEQLGNVEKGTKQVMHKSTALSLVGKGLVKVGSAVKNWKPNKAKD